ncbi:hypothetical protein [Thioclava sp.]|jgi:hypothetical protein|uniref:DUF7673 family protein n=1 Tax=Thioclava sp. TaxID=1933450 RepID=UPI0032428D24
MDLTAAIHRLSIAAHAGTGASAGAATVLLFAWNSVHPMRGLLSLDGDNRLAALIVIEAALDYDFDCEREVETSVGHSNMQALAREYGVEGTAWAR